jgi:small subunit ribosomal protein S3Ae
LAKKVTGKVKDKWKLKQWITVLASPSFGNAPITKIPVNEPKNCIGRTIETTLYDILKQDPQHYNFKLFFKIDRIEGDTALTVLNSHEYSREYLRSLIRRGSSMADFINDYKTKDEYLVRVYCIAFTQGHMNSAKKHKIRLIMDKIMRERASSLTYDQFVQEMVLQKIASDVYNEAKKVTHLRHVGIRKSKLIKRSTQLKEVETLAPPAA